ncbi:GDP-mannose 4,6-dehydratase [Candidatus Desantisbacteria bacterium CG1_02_38_46]|uniref:GDP-mannose 4,6-dehydratase n=2 Tax=unclassified Candidatus Desantisiibacteriota TaxID=3106372 RepID=A0A2H9PAK2_9BACT|nr:MAG: GDP-mannose 4,6-dehydratase [Candidatus Desantisbacteria bacterium CG1_02_38_46]PIZ15514.1 MAG: GDP-mannose 4,6-dehydratase [Candidatus Desantisbacteria bacterium CG_4_10_14_0_8_um_filter_39_17]
MRVLITGISGFVGSHLAEFLLANGAEVYGSIRWRSQTENIDHLKEKLKLIDCDIRDASSVEKVIRESKPDLIYHLAAQSFVPTSWNAPSETLVTNIIGELNIFEAVRHLQIAPKIHITGSSEEYGLVYENELPIRETNPLRPLSPYGVSKVAQDLLGWQYFQSYKLNIVRTRAFNHTGPRRGEVFVTSNFSKQIAMIEKGLQEPVMMVGNLEARRDFSDVRDVVRAYWLALEKGEVGEVYNICSGKTRKIQEVLDILFGMTKSKIEIKQDPARIRPSDVTVLQGDSTKFRTKTGWNPEIPFEKTLEDLLNYWRKKLEKLS